jgi:hypothetical protein
MKDDDIKIIEQMRDEFLQAHEFVRNAYFNCSDSPRLADALTNLLAEVIETRDMLAVASKDSVHDQR